MSKLSRLALDRLLFLERRAYEREASERRKAGGAMALSWEVLAEFLTAAFNAGWTRRLL